MSLVLDVITWLLIPAGLLPVVTAIVLSQYRHSDSRSLRDRWHLAVVLALIGGIASLIAIAAVTGTGGGWLWIPFGLGLLGADVVSGKWLVEYFMGGFR